jgi:hypothetical protein
VVWKFDLEAHNGWSFRTWIGVSAAVMLAGCSVTAPFSAAPRLPPNSGAASPSADRPMAVPLSGPPPAPPGLNEPSAPRRQYFDQKRRKYYYFDPVKKQYFWEDGTPK